MANIYDKALAFKKKLEELDSASLTLITAEYKRTLKKMRGDFEKMAKRVAEHPNTPTPYELGRMKEIQQGIADVESEMERLHGRAAGIIGKAQDANVKLIGPYYEDLINGLADTYGAEGVQFAKVNPKAFEKMVGFTSSGSPLVDVLKKHSTLKKADIVSTLRHASLIGENPTRTAQKMVNAGYDDMSHALLVARTETMRVAQEVGNENFKKNGVEYVQWVSGETAYTCAACWAMSGRIFEVGKAPHDHPNGRCVFNPYLPELAELDPDLYKHDPEENFAKLSEEEQREILGPAKFEAWKSGEFKLSDFVAETNSKDYGESIKIPSLKDLGLDKTPAERYNIDESLADKFNKGVPPEMRKLFAPYLQSGKVDPDFNDSGVSKVVKDAKGYVHPLDLAVKMEQYTESQLGGKKLKGDFILELADPGSYLRDWEVDPRAAWYNMDPPGSLLAGVSIANQDQTALLPIFKICKEGMKGSETVINQKVAHLWEAGSWDPIPTQTKIAASILWGGDIFDPYGHGENSCEVIWQMLIAKNIYDNGRETLHKLYPNGKVDLYRAEEPPLEKHNNTLESWTSQRSFANDWGLIRVNAQNPNYRWNSYDVKGPPDYGPFDVDAIFLFDQNDGGLLEYYSQAEYVIMGGLAKI